MASSTLTAAESSHGFGRRERSLASLALSVDNSGCLGVQLFFDPAESGSEQSEDEGSECEPGVLSNHARTQQRSAGLCKVLGTGYAYEASAGIRKSPPT